MQKTALKIAKYIPWLYFIAKCFFALLGSTLIIGLISLKIEELKTLFMVAGFATIGTLLLITLTGAFFYISLWFYCKKTYKYLLKAGREISVTVNSAKIILMSPSKIPAPNIIELVVEYGNLQKLHFIDFTWTISSLKHRYVPRSGEKTTILYDQNLQLASLKRPLKGFEL